MAEPFREALELLNQPAAANGDRPARSALVAAADRVKTDAAKFGVMVSGGDSLSAAESAALLEALQSSARGFCACCHACTAGAAPTMLADMRKVATAVVHPCIGLVKALEHAHAGDIKHQVGLVWQGCDAVKRAPMDNKSSLFKHLADVYVVIKDTLREMDELQEEQDEEGDSSENDSDDEQEAAGTQQPNSNGGSAPTATTSSHENGSEPTSSRGAGPDIDADLDFEAGPMSTPEQQVLVACRQLMDVGGRSLKALSKCLLEGPPLQPGDALDGWESTLFHARHLQRCVEDLGASMYPPQDGEEVGSSAQALHDTVGFLLDECPAADALGGQLQELQQELQQAHEALTASLQTQQAADTSPGGS